MFARTNERTYACYLNKPENPIYLKKLNLKKPTKTDLYIYIYFKNVGTEVEAAANLGRRAAPAGGGGWRPRRRRGWGWGWPRVRVSGGWALGPGAAPNKGPGQGVLAEYGPKSVPRFF